MFLAPDHIIREYRAILVRYRGDSIAEWTLALLNYVIHVDVISHRELLGQFESGLTARYMGNVVSVVFGGCVTIGVAAFSWVKSPTLKDLKY
jgi:hypothetical protein